MVAVSIGFAVKKQVDQCQNSNNINIASLLTVDIQVDL